MLTPAQESKLKHSIAVMNTQLVTRKERRRQKELIQSRLTELENLEREIKNEERNFKQARLFAIKFQNDKRLKDTEMIKRSMKVASELVLQKTRIYPKFHTTNGRYPESDLVVEQEGRRVTLEGTEGTGVAESVSFLTLLSVLQSTQYIKTCLLDEYFSSVSPINSERISKVLNHLVDDKFQLILIEQKDEIVKYANYREFKVSHDGTRSTVETQDVICEEDFDSDETLTMDSLTIDSLDGEDMTIG